MRGPGGAGPSAAAHLQARGSRGASQDPQKGWISHHQAPVNPSLFCGITTAAPFTSEDTEAQSRQGPGQLTRLLAPPTAPTVALLLGFHFHTWVSPLKVGETRMNLSGFIPGTIWQRRPPSSGPALHDATLVFFPSLPSSASPGERCLPVCHPSWETPMQSGGLDHRK